MCVLQQGTSSLSYPHILHNDMYVLHILYYLRIYQLVPHPTAHHHGMADSGQGRNRKGGFNDNFKSILLLPEINYYYTLLNSVVFAHYWP